MDEAMEKRWRELSEEVLSGMKEWRQAHPAATFREIEDAVKEWRQAHPAATFREIEDAVHERMSRLEAQILQETALSSKQTDWATEPKDKRPSCPNCGTALQPRGKRKRDLQGSGGTTIHLERTYGTCPQCGMGLFPPR